MTADPAVVADVVTETAAYGLSAQSIVGVPPSTLDPWPAQMRVRINGYEVAQPYDPTDA